MNFQLFDAIYTMSIIGFLHTSQMACDNNGDYKGLLICLASFFLKKQQLQLIQHACLRRPDRDIVASKKIWEPHTSGRESSIGNIHAGRYSGRNQHKDCRLHSADQYVIITVCQCPMDGEPVMQRRVG